MAEAANNQEKQFSLQKLYVKDVSFETPNSPEIFTRPWDPKVEFNLASNAKQLQENLFEVTVTTTLTVTVEEKTAYLVEVCQAGIFAMVNFDEEELSRCWVVTVPISSSPMLAKPFPIWSPREDSRPCCWHRSILMPFTPSIYNRFRHRKANQMKRRSYTDVDRGIFGWLAYRFWGRDPGGLPSPFYWPGMVMKPCCGGIMPSTLDV